MAARQPYTYTQKLKDNHYKLVQDKGRLTGYLNGRELFSSTAGIDVMTSPAGKILGLAGIDTVARNVQLKTGGKSYQATIEPNGYYRLTASGIQLLRKVPFDFPYQKRKPLKISNLRSRYFFCFFPLSVFSPKIFHPQPTQVQLSRL